jgi:hypothetical protein
MPDRRGSLSAVLPGVNRDALGGSNAHLHHTGNFVLGTNGWSFFSALRQHARFLSPKEFQPSPQHNFLRRESAAQVFFAALPTELQRLAPLAGLEPATVDLRSNPCPHHAANSRIFSLIPLPPYFITSITCAHHYRSSTNVLSFRQLAIEKNSGRN